MPHSRVTAGWFFWEFSSRGLPRLARVAARGFPWRPVQSESKTNGVAPKPNGAEPRRKGTEPKIREKETSEQKVSA
jgi:hypothetical protein